MRKMYPVVRPPQSDDEDVWRRLWTAYLDFYQTEIPPEATQRTWERILDPAGAMLGRVGEVDGTVSGFAISVVHEGTWSVRPTCYLEDLFVEPAARGAGLGRALIEHLLALGSERGWSSLYWHTRAGNAAARRLYDRYMTADDYVRYRLPLR